MFVKQHSSRGEQSDVQYCEGRNEAFGVRLNCFAFFQDGVLIDTGSHSLRQVFRPFIDDVQPDMTMITHYHEDHTGNALYCAEQNIPVYMNPLYKNDCMKKANYPFYRRFFWGKRPPFSSQDMPETFSSRNAHWRVLSTPGHAADHVSFLNESTGQLFSGDLYVSPKTKVALREESIPTIIRSIEHVLEHDFSEMFCCHAGYIKDGKKKLHYKLNYLRGVQEKVIQLNKEGYKIEEIKQSLFPKKYPIITFSRGEWDSKYIVSSILKER